MTRMATLGASALLVLATSANALATDLPNCLHAQAEPGQTESRCLGDAYHLAEHQTVRNAIEALGLQKVTITFSGCPSGTFGTTPTGAHAYRITYKLPRITKPDQMFELLLPVMHELGHVFQVEHYGSIGRMRDKMESIARIELGADFIAGALYKWRWRAPNTTAFNASVELMGDYHADDADYHGRPEDRAASFQFGFDYPLSGIDRNILFGPHAQEFWDAHETFQADDFAALTEMQ